MYHHGTVGVEIAFSVLQIKGGLKRCTKVFCNSVLSSGPTEALRHIVENC